MIQDHKNFAAYEAAEAARILGISSQKIRRWLCGYKYTSHGTQKYQQPLWHPEIQNSDDLYISFRDLIEIRFVDAFVKAGLSKNSVRLLLANARSLIDSDYPLSTTQFRTDGRTIFLETLSESDEYNAVDVKNGQHVFQSVVRPSFRDLVFDDGIVTKWYVNGKSKKIAIDPDVAFGQPVIDETGIPTARLFEAFLAEGSERIIAQQFEVPLSAVRNAIEFERQIG